MRDACPTYLLFQGDQVLEGSELRAVDNSISHLWVRLPYVEESSKTYNIRAFLPTASCPVPLSKRIIAILRTSCPRYRDLRIVTLLEDLNFRLSFAKP